MSELTAKDVVEARRRFVDSYYLRGSGWFQDREAAENMFDNLAREGALTTEWLKAMTSALEGEEK